MKSNHMKEERTYSNLNGYVPTFRNHKALTWSKLCVPFETTGRLHREY